MNTTELPAPVLAPYTNAQVRFAGSAWPMRAAEELRSAQIFRALARAAGVAGMAEPWPTRFATTARDEVRHARPCVLVGRELGAAKPRYDMRPVRARLAGLPDPFTQRLGWTGFTSVWPMLAESQRAASQ